MSDGFTIGAASYASTLFSCPACNETIDNTAQACRFCGQPVDYEAALKGAQLLSKINQACSDASYMKSSAWALPVFFLLRFVPFVSMLGLVGFFGLLIGIPIWALRWWLKYASIASRDADFLRARKMVKLTALVVSGLLALFVLAPFVSGFLTVLRH